MSIYAIGHKSPDLDSAAAAISYANLKNKLTDSKNYIPVVAGEINQVTEFVLEKFGFAKPEILEDASGKDLILVDHNEESQRVAGDVRIVEILDHHKMNFKYADPIEIQVKPWGSSCSIIFTKYKKNNIEIDKNLAGLLLSAVLDDTVITKSPTCTKKDKEIIVELASLAGINDWQEYGLEMFKKKSSIKGLSVSEIIKMDYKDFQFQLGKFGIGQVETVDLGEFENLEEEILEKLEKIRKDENYHSVILFITDIIKEGSRFLIASSEEEKLEQALENKFENNKSYIKGIISRKKQVIPMLSKVFDK